MSDGLSPDLRERWGFVVAFQRTKPETGGIKAAFPGFTEPCQPSKVAAATVWPAVGLRAERRLSLAALHGFKRL